MLFSGQPLHLQVGEFEGPLDLLLHLIKTHAVDIFDIPISFITEKYLAYIDAMRELDLGVAGEYLVMAATLIQIKSQMLLPKPETAEADDGDGALADPREMLVRRLLEYQRYKDAARLLTERELIDRDVFRRPSRAEELVKEIGPPELVPIELFQLLTALGELLKGKPAEVIREISPDRLTVRQQMTTIAEHLRKQPRAALLELVYLNCEEPTRLDVVITFLAILELTKLKMIRITQTSLTARDLYIEMAVADWDPDSAWLDGGGEPV